MPKENTFLKGAKLEAAVADIYWELGAYNVKTNLRLSGQQVDVYAELHSADGFVTRVAVDCKNYKGRVGVNEVNKSAQKLSLLKQSGVIDLAALVSVAGFTPEASTAASALGVRTMLLTDLLRRVADFTGYLDRANKKYEQSQFHKLGLYRRLHCKSEAGVSLGLIDDFVTNWFASGGRFLTLLGDYGTGKTTFASRFFWQSSKEYLADPLRKRVPVFIPLKRYRKEINIRSLITDLLLHDYHVQIRDYGAFKELNKRGRLIIILDAFDEMASGAIESEVISNFRELKSLALDESQVLLTCRTHYLKDQGQLHKLHYGTSLYKEIDQEDSSYEICYLSPYTSEDVKSLVRICDPAHSEEYLQIIESTYNLGELSKHPILLDMILGTVPEVLSGKRLLTPSDLYTTYTRFWLDRDDWRTKMNHEQREFFMKEIAFHFQVNGRTEIHFTHLPRHIRQKFPGLKTFKELDWFEEDIRTCTFLVRDPMGNYSFAHRSFCEYFAARCAADHFLKGDWPDSLWKGCPHSPTSWISPETAAFVVDLIEKANGFESVLVNFYRSSLNGVLLLNILALYLYSDNPRHKELYDVAYWLVREEMLGGVDFRREISALADKHHTPNWRRVKKDLESHFRDAESASPSRWGGDRDRK